MYRLASSGAKRIAVVKSAMAFSKQRCLRAEIRRLSLV
jgi:hypothetical protein